MTDTNVPGPGTLATLHLHGGMKRTYTVAWATPCGSRIALDDGTNRSSVHSFAHRGHDGNGNVGYFWNGFQVTFGPDSDDREIWNARVAEKSDTHFCGNCLGDDPDTCLHNGMKEGT